jgi:hypothetical protein
MDDFKGSPAYYEGALGGYKLELEHLASFGSGRLEQWEMLLADYRTAINRLAVANKRIKELEGI